MERSTAEQGLVPGPTLVPGQRTGCYVYCVAPGGEKAYLGSLGLDSSNVHSVVYRRLCAVVHYCPAQPYQSSDPEVVAAWVLAHHRVVDAAWKRYGTVLPLTFNTIIKAEGDRSADDNLKAWLEEEYESLKGKLEAFKGKAEYGVQVFWDPAAVSKQVAACSSEVRALEEQIHSKSRGLAYMYRQRLDAVLKKEMEARAVEEFKELYERISGCADNVHVEKVKQGEPGLQMFMNLSCLVSTKRYADLAAELDKVSTAEGRSVRLVGPLPPYSFC